MLEYQKYGWFKFKFGEFDGCPSDVTNVVSDSLQAFIDWYRTGTGMAWFDEEQYYFTLVLTPFTAYVVYETDDESMVCEMPETMTIPELADQLRNDIVKDIDGFAKAQTICPENLYKVKSEIITKLNELSIEISRYDGITRKMWGEWKIQNRS